MIPFYDPALTYEQNYAEGPFGELTSTDPFIRSDAPAAEFFGHRVHLPFGMPAGPLLNANFCAAAFAQGYDINVYKTVRSDSYPCNPFPNVLSVHVDGPLTIERAAHPVLADTDYSQPVSISNSFGVPSRSPDVWQPDMQRAIASAGTGQLLVGSFQGTKPPTGTSDPAAAYIADHVRAAALVAETGAPVLELNLSCPNEGTADLLCFDVPRVGAIVRAVKEQIGDLPLLLKLAYFVDDEHLARLVATTRGVAQGYSTINTIPARLVDADGNQALPGAGRATSGVCGAAVTWAGLDMVTRLNRLREQPGDDFSIVGVGGVMAPADYTALRAAGADAVMSATGAMFNPRLAREIDAAVRQAA